MKKLRVNVNQGYNILIEKGILSSCGEYIKSVSSAERVCIVSDSNVFPLYGTAAASNFDAAGYSVYSFVFAAGEASKTPDTVLKILSYLADNEFTRADLIVALGGGVTGDVAGLAASLYLRGIDYVQIPTTLLAQADSSVGGKTAVDLPQGKNLCGAFHQPVLVLIDPRTLETLTPRDFSNGMAEVIKMACIASKALFDKLACGDIQSNIDEIIYECVSLKAAIVERDEKEQGERALLNFGHTAGHAIEKLGGFSTVMHGEAVAIGMVMAAGSGERRGITEPGTAEIISNILTVYGLPISDSHSISEIVAATVSDKKRLGDSIRLSLIRRIGEGFIYEIKYEDLESFFGA